jgi:hypothetical protein
MKIGAAVHDGEEIVPLAFTIRHAHLIDLFGRIVRAMSMRVNAEGPTTCDPPPGRDSETLARQVGYYSLGRQEGRWISFRPAHWITFERR